MDVTREIVLMLIQRMRKAERETNRALQLKVSGPEIAFYEGQRMESADACQIARAIYHTNRGNSRLTESERLRRISVSAQLSEFVTFEDGYTYWWPAGSPHGAHSAWDLRILADELDRRNRIWDQKVRKAFEKGSN